MTGVALGNRVVVVMGVSGCGKTTVGRRLADRLAVPFLDADDLHSAANRATMASGRPLDEADRRPWLEAVSEWIRTAADRSGGVLACSALRHAYRALLRPPGADVWFVHLSLDPALALQRISARKGHFMPPELLDSQYRTLEPLGADEPGVTVDASGSTERTVEAALQALARPAHPADPIHRSQP
ncbi:gluconokinase [Kitasatospora sp. A2-31]|uniref:gluconokinase n=1 Tax=Kitasatospora sp. A2-31 TaxID=2916414 RepID=UPI001EEA9C27|nr:gluconokinase [Kitasatospora sp. A2-31]MCG6498241.1 gluconokinase [Kitasatospora sp. A2-31]